MWIERFDKEAKSDCGERKEGEECMREVKGWSD